MTGYVLDGSALTAGLTHCGREHHRRALSRLVRSAAKGGPILDVPALCLVEAAATRSTVAGHVADLVASAPQGAIIVHGLEHNEHLDAVRTTNPGLDWASTHAAMQAITTRMVILTADADRYREVPVDVIPL